jgi:hypothetical protein
MAWERIEGDGGMGGWGCGAHLDRGDLRYQRKQARIGRLAVLAVVRAAAVVKQACAVLLLAALVQAVVGVPVGRAVHTPPVELPVGAVLGVDLVPVVRRGHGEPAGVALLVLSSVGPIFIIIIENSEAEDTDAVVGVPIPYD